MGVNRMSKEGKTMATKTPEYPITKCGSCAAEIIWAETEAGKPQPVDAKPVKRIIFTKQEGKVQPRSSVVDTYMPHHATCPNASQHRKAG